MNWEKWAFILALITTSFLAGLNLGCDTVANKVVINSNDIKELRNITISINKSVMEIANSVAVNRRLLNDFIQASNERLSKNESELHSVRNCLNNHEKQDKIMTIKDVREYSK